MDELLRQSERAFRGGDPDARLQLERRLQRAIAGPLTVEDRVAFGLFDVFNTRLREDIVEASIRAREEDPRQDHGGWASEDPSWWPVELLVNGRRLADLADLGDASYTPQLPARVVYLPARHLLGEPLVERGAWAEPDDRDGKTLLLFCGCGDSGCGRLVADIVVGASAVTWTGLEHRPQGRRLDLELVFEREAYERALQDPA